MLLAVDLGGTHARMALFEGDELIRNTSLATSEHSSFELALGGFLRASDMVEAAAIAVAGPVSGRVCAMTNLDWVVDADAIERLFPVRKVALLNDFEAVAWGLDALDRESVEVLQSGERDPLGPRVLIGAGTGLGKAVAIPRPGGATVLRSEGGHVDFAARTDQELELLRYLRERHGRVSLERVVSGLGLRSIYEFLVESGRVGTDPALRERIASGDAGALIAEHAQRDEACEATMQQFVSLYGAAAGNLALEVLPTGGLFIAGGIATKLIARLREPRFMESFSEKEPMQDLLRRVQVAVVLDPAVGLRGAARRAAALITEPKGVVSSR